ncbi:hypothetical protein BGZ61DRAFT_536242 [Ilyonectria robusta]|uniref:uncharacterized protein n=1 Tax=Ilyonectria robusta TaxID=1079257 RepID=UPI001E8E3215|nr:uncharacterized protein BGZ61DRAFT_536242 [Ilyonectria robusta]KAH8674936.1 hypothetical protein BGZ61DRAFT_536242 [Ilyonectria robusta]
MVSLKTSALGLVHAAFFLVARCSAKECVLDECLGGVMSRNVNSRGAASRDCISFFQQGAETTTTTIITTKEIETPVTEVIVYTITDSIIKETFTKHDYTHSTTVPVKTLPLQLTTTITATETTTTTLTTTSVSSVIVTSFVAPPTEGKLYYTAPIPTYASGCSGVVSDYSSACSCIGATESPLITETEIYTIQSTPTAMIETTREFEHITTRTTRTRSDRVKKTSYYTSYVTITSIREPLLTAMTTTTLTSTITETSTTFVTGPTQFCKLNLIAQGGNVDGRLVYIDRDRAVLAPLGSVLRTLFQFDRGSRLRPLDGGSVGKVMHQVVVSPFIELRSEEDVKSTFHYNTIYCQVHPGTFEITCQSRENTLHPWYFSEADQTANGPFLWLKAFPSNDIPIRIFAIPVGCIT